MALMITKNKNRGKKYIFIRTPSTVVSKQYKMFSDTTNDSPIFSFSSSSSPFSSSLIDQRQPLQRQLPPWRQPLQRQPQPQPWLLLLWLLLQRQPHQPSLFQYAAADRRFWPSEATKRTGVGRSWDKRVRFIKMKEKPFEEVPLRKVSALSLFLRWRPEKTWIENQCAQTLSK